MNETTRDDFFRSAWRAVGSLAAQGKDVTETARALNNMAIESEPITVEIPVTLTLTQDEALALLECYRVLGDSLGAVRPDLRKDAHKAAWSLGSAWRKAVQESEGEDYCPTDPTPGHKRCTCITAHQVEEPQGMGIAAASDLLRSSGEAHNSFLCLDIACAPCHGLDPDPKHSDDGTCHDECWNRAVREMEEAQKAVRKTAHLAAPYTPGITLCGIEVRDLMVSQPVYDFRDGYGRAATHPCGKCDRIAGSWDGSGFTLSAF